MIATFINVGSILIGTLLGCLLHRGLPEQWKTHIMQAMGLAVMILGIADGIKTAEPLLLVLALVLGTLTGTALRIETGLTKLGETLQHRLPGGEGQSGFAQGFMTATVMFCVGSMAILGSLKAGLNGDMSLILVKSVLDGVTSLILSSTLGWGVGLAALPVLLYQGGITLAAAWVAPLVSDALLNELTAVGGVLILAIGITMTGIKKLPTGDMLPALLVPVLWFLIF